MLTVPPLAPEELELPLDAPADEDDELDELDELPQAPMTSAAMTVSTMAAAGLMYLFTDPPPQRSNSQG
jgi:hypothetical protein